MYKLIRVFTRLAILTALTVWTTFACAQTLYMSDEVKEQLRADYQHHTIENLVEFCFCLYGAENDTSTVVVARYLPQQRQTHTSVWWRPCPVVWRGLHYVAYGHSHPPNYPNTPRPSRLDIETFMAQNVRHTLIIYTVGTEMMVTLLTKQ